MDKEPRPKCPKCNKGAGGLRDFQESDGRWCPHCKMIYSEHQQEEIENLKYKLNQTDQENRSLREQVAAQAGFKRQRDTMYQWIQEHELVKEWEEYCQSVVDKATAGGKNELWRAFNDFETKKGETSVKENEETRDIFADLRKEYLALPEEKRHKAEFAVFDMYQDDENLQKNFQNIKDAMKEDPKSWWVPYHHTWGQCIRNYLRQEGYGEKYWPVDNLDDIYVFIVEGATECELSPGDYHE